jgi:hypothetical protein
MEKRPELENDHSPTGVEVENKWGHTSTSSYASKTYCLIKHRKNFKILQISAFLKICISWKIFEKERSVLYNDSDSC